MMKNKTVYIKLAICLFLPLSMLLSVPVQASVLHERSESTDWMAERVNECWQEDFDGAYGCQCVDLVMAYYSYLLDWYSHGNAKDYLTNELPAGWSRVYEDPAPGDVVVWGPGADMGDGFWADQTYGHAGLVYSLLSNGNIETVETNAGTTFASYYERSTADVGCYIRPDFADVPSDVVLSDPPSDIYFEDVDPSAWYYDYVYEIANLGYMTGLDETHFGPDCTMSRAMTVTVLYRIAGQPEASNESCFLDVKANLWYTQPINWAVEASIVSGYTGDLEGYFGTEDDVTREQLAVMLFRFQNYCGYDTSPRADLDVFEDAEQISPYAKDAMSYCVAVGILSGSNNGTQLNPTVVATRAECSKMFLQTLNV